MSNENPLSASVKPLSEDQLEQVLNAIEAPVPSPSLFAKIHRMQLNPSVWNVFANSIRKPLSTPRYWPASIAAALILGFFAGQSYPTFSDAMNRDSSSRSQTNIATAFNHNESNTFISEEWYAAFETPDFTASYVASLAEEHSDQPEVEIELNSLPIQ